MVLALTGAGISKPSGIKTFDEQPEIREYLYRNFANENPKKYNQVIKKIERNCKKAKPNDAHIALSEYEIPIITMNVDTLHEQAGSRNLLKIHGTIPDIILYDDPAPLYKDAIEWVGKLREGDFLLIVGVSFSTEISKILRRIAYSKGADVYEINDRAETRVRYFLERADTPECTFENFIRR